MINTNFSNPLQNGLMKEPALNVHIHTSCSVEIGCQVITDLNQNITNKKEKRLRYWPNYCGRQPDTAPALVNFYCDFFNFWFCIHGYHQYYVDFFTYKSFTHYSLLMIKKYCSSV